ncbi:DUF4398 domain-containing protein [Methylophilus sp. 13]|uniref:DUF4398 domain-containing protein n=1 Tax=Methylophilus sp. 13 TaxID=2781018 RepID=UPI001E2A5FE1|nr:DUF4398 domain-containing protein [Methylophilus sp. 13]
MTIQLEDYPIDASKANKPDGLCTPVHGAFNCRLEYLYAPGTKCLDSYKEKHMAHTLHLPQAKSHRLLSWGLASAFTALLLLSGCASTPKPPTSALQAAEQAIASAERASVADYAAVELSTARDKLSAAHSAVQEQKMILAQRLAQQARADAELASALAEVAKARVVNEQMQKGTDTLKMEMKRKTGDQ